jgi:hypothetical protein
VTLALRLPSARRLHPEREGQALEHAGFAHPASADGRVETIDELDAKVAGERGAGEREVREPVVQSHKARIALGGSQFNGGTRQKSAAEASIRSNNFGVRPMRARPRSRSQPAVLLGLQKLALQGHAPSARAGYAVPSAMGTSAHSNVGTASASKCGASPTARSQNSTPQRRSCQPSSVRRRLHPILSAVLVVLPLACGARSPLDLSASGASGFDASSPPPIEAGPCLADTESDPLNCGRCGHSCQGGLCAAGVCQPVTIAISQEEPIGIAVNDAGLFWATWGGDTILQLPLPLSGSAPYAPNAIASAQKYPTGIAIGGSIVCWTNENSAGSVVDIVPGAAAPLTLASSLPDPFGIATDGATIYWSNLGYPTNGGSVVEVPVGGGNVTTLASGLDNPRGVAIDATSVYWAEAGADASGDANGAMRSVPRSGGPPATLASNQLSPVAVAVDATRAYWANAGSGAGSSDGAILAVPLGGGTPTTLAAGQASPAALAVDSSGVYWSTLGASGNGNGAILVAPLGGGSPRVLALAQAGPRAIAVDATAVYWTNFNGGDVMKVAK